MSISRIYTVTIAIFLPVLLVITIEVDYGIESVEAKVSQSMDTGSVDESYANGDSLFNQGKYEEAITYFDKVLTLAPNDKDTLYYKGISLDSLGKHEEAITYFDKVLSLDPNNVNTLTYKGISLDSLGKHEEAITYFDRVLSLDPNNANTLSWKQYSLNNMNKHDIIGTDQVGKLPSIDTHNMELNNAKDKAKRIISYVISTIFPQTGEKFSNTNYGVDMTFPKSWTGFEMKIIFPMAILSPDGFDITDLFSSYIDSFLDNVAESIVANNMSDLSEQEFQKLIEPNVRESAELLSTNLIEYMENKSTTMSIFIYDRELVRFINSANPNITRSVSSLTSLYEGLVAASNSTIRCDTKTMNQTVLQNNIPAEVSTEQCFLAPNNKNQSNLNYLVLTPRAMIGIQYSSDSNNQSDKNLREFAESLKTLSIKESLPINNLTIQQFVYDVTNNDTSLNNIKNNSTNDNSISVFMEKGNSLFDLGRYEEAIAWYDKVLGIVPTNVNALLQKGISLGSLSKDEEALAVFDKILEIDPINSQALGNKGVALANLGRYNESIIWYDKVLKADPKNVNILTFKGASLGDLGRHEEALGLIDQALKINPSFVGALYNKGKALGSLGRYEDAIAWYDKALAVDPRFISALYNKAVSLYDLGRYEESITWYDKALAVDSKYASALANKGAALGQLGRYEESITWYDKALAVHPRNEITLFSKGTAFAKLGNYEEAIIWFDRALEIDPSDADALNAKGVALAYLGKTKDAIYSWEKTLAVNPTNQDALIMKSYFEKLTSAGLSNNTDILEKIFEK